MDETIRLVQGVVSHLDVAEKPPDGNRGGDLRAAPRVHSAGDPPRWLSGEIWRPPMLAGLVAGPVAASNLDSSDPILPSSAYLGRECVIEPTRWKVEAADDNDNHERRREFDPDGCGQNIVEPTERPVTGVTDPSRARRRHKGCRRHGGSTCRRRSARRTATVAVAIGRATCRGPPGCKVANPGRADPTKPPPALSALPVYLDVSDDLGDRIPVTSAELDVIEAFLGSALAAIDPELADAAPAPTALRR